METLNWFSPVSALFKKSSPSIEKLDQAGFKTIFDLLWIIPNKIDIVPPVAPFDKAMPGSTFKGRGNVLNIQSRPSFRGRGKRGVQLFNISVNVKDHFSHSTISLKFFNSYPSILKKIQSLSIFEFQGEVSVFGNTLQVTNPKIIENEDFREEEFSINIVYPAINTIKPTTVASIIDRIPKTLWDDVPKFLPKELCEKRDLIPSDLAIKILHGKTKNFQTKQERALETLAYYEFFIEQIKVYARKAMSKKSKSVAIDFEQKFYNRIKDLFPYHLTSAQRSSLEDIFRDLKSGTTMMRLIQGDVGSGKTTVALISAIIVISKGFQAAIMCPTESLALQHYLSMQSILEKLNIKSELLVGSLKPSQKKNVQEKIEKGEIQFVIGTHSLIQKSLKFKNLKYCIIDEQHKFGVNQRISLLDKGESVHCLIMTATPIPRSLCLTQYGDLEISTIKEMPNANKKISTKIVSLDNFQTFLSFVKTRLSMKEQVYVVVPAIQENPEMDLLNVEKVFEKFSIIYDGFKVAALHGKLKNEEKEAVLKGFIEAKIDLLISTSVVEVGINVPNSTVMAIMSPERFGLSSLHQLRGRVGRGSKPGFCFLVLDKKISPESLNRLQVIENSTDGFFIAEEDLKIRGQGDIFGKEQSGRIEQKRVANIVTHSDLLSMAREDVLELSKNNKTWLLGESKKIIKDSYVTVTI